MKLAKLLPAAAVAVFAAQSASAQNNWMNRIFNFDATWAGIAFGSTIQSGGMALDTIPAEEMVDWGINTAVSGTDQEITGLQWVLQDFNPSTPHNYTMVGYTEDPNNPDQPDLANPPTLSYGPFASPTIAGQTTPGVWIFTLDNQAAATFPRESDVFVGVDLPGVTSATDILTMQFIDADLSNTGGVGGAIIATVPSPAYGQTGTGTATNGTHLLGVTTGVQAATPHTFAGSQIIDVQVFGPGGHAFSNSNEVENTATANGPITTPCTAYYPDVLGANGAGRLDSAGFLYQDDEFTQGFVGLVVGVSLNPLNNNNPGGPFSMTNVAPGGRGQGNVCTDIITGNPITTLLFAPSSTGANGEQYFSTTLTIPPSIVIVGQPLDAVWQGVTFDRNTRSVRSSGCTIQALNR